MAIRILNEKITIITQVLDANNNGNNINNNNTGSLP